jgi:hypothetical protein
MPHRLCREIGNHIGGCQHRLSAASETDLAICIGRRILFRNTDRNGVTAFGDEQSPRELREVRKLRGLRDRITIPRRPAGDSYEPPKRMSGNREAGEQFLAEHPVEIEFNVGEFDEPCGVAEQAQELPVRDEARRGAP